MVVDVARRRFSVQEYDHLAETGFFGPEERLSPLSFPEITVDVGDILG